MNKNKQQLTPQTKEHRLWLKISRRSYKLIQGKSWGAQEPITIPISHQRFLHPQTSTITPLHHLNPQSWTSVEFCWPEGSLVIKQCFKHNWAYESLRMSYMS